MNQKTNAKSICAQFRMKLLESNPTSLYQASSSGSYSIPKSMEFISSIGKKSNPAKETRAAERVIAFGGMLMFISGIWTII